MNQLKVVILAVIIVISSLFILNVVNAVSLVDEDFEGTGTPSGWFSGSINFDSTTSPLEGAQSMRGDTGQYAVIFFIPNEDEMWGRFLFRTGNLPASYEILFSIENAASAYVFQAYYWNDGLVLASDYGGAGVYDYSVGALSANTPYYVWFHYKKGTGTNGVIDLMFDTTCTTRPAAGSDNWAGGTVSVGTTDVDHINIYGASVIHDFDDLQISNTDDFATCGDSTPPTITSISSDKVNGNYTIGEVIDIDVTFSEAVTSTGDVTVTLETGATDRTCTFTVSNSTTGTCDYTVQSGDTSADLDATVSGTIADQASNAMVSFTPATGLAANEGLVIDTTADAAPGTPDMTSDTDSGFSSTDNITSDTTPDFTISCVSGSTVTLYDNITSVGTGVCSSSTVIITSSALSSGTHATMNAKQTDIAGNVSSASSDLSIVIDTSAPTITSISSDKVNGNYTIGEVIDIDVTFSEAVTSTGDVTVTLETGATDRTCTFTVSNSTTGTCDYTVQSGDTSADLDATVSGTIADQASNAMVSFTPATGLAANEGLVIDAIISSPTLTTSDASSVTGSDAILNGNITATGNENATVRGFQYGTTTSYGITTTTSGSFSTGAFTDNLTSLSCGTTYHFLSYATNSAGTGTSSDNTFTTSACAISGAVSGNSGSGSLPPQPRPPSDGYIFSIFPNPTESTYVTLNFKGGEDITKIAIANNENFYSATYIDYVTATPWIVESIVGEQTLYVKFCNQYNRCGETMSSKVIYTPLTPSLPQKSFIDNFIPDFLKENPPELKIELPTVKKISLRSLAGKWKLIPGKIINNFVLAPLPSDVRVLTEKFPDLAQVFTSLGITKMTDLEKLKDARINIPIIAKTKDTPTEIIMVHGGQGNVAIGSSVVLTSSGEVEQKINTISGKKIILSIKPEGQASSIEGYLLYKHKMEKTIMEIPSNSLAANVFLSQVNIVQVSSLESVIEPELLVLSFEYIDSDGDGIYTAEISAPVVEGEYEVLTIINYKDKGSKELRMITVVDPEGYVYYLNSNKDESRLSDATVSIFDADTDRLWNASKYSQYNPQNTDKTGKYSFLVPEGKYYITVKAKKYQPYKSENFDVKEGLGIHFNIEMKEKSSWLRALYDWKVLVILIFGIALIINFINDRRFRKQLSILDTKSGL